MSNEEKAREYIAQAERKLSSRGFLGMFGSADSKYEEAGDLYGKAANLYKMAKKWREAGDTFVVIARLRAKALVKHETAAAYVDAANCYRKENGEKAVEALEHAVEIYTDMGRFTIAAKQEALIAEIYETDLAKIEDAMKAYEKAAEWYQGEESQSAANKCLQKVAYYSAQLERYSRAIEIYEEIASKAIESNILKFSAKDHFLKAGLCHLATKDLVTAQQAVERYVGMYPAFEGTREHKLLVDLLAAYEEESVETFTNVVAEYDSVSRLDPWMTTMLLRIKQSMNETDIL